MRAKKNAKEDFFVGHLVYAKSQNMRKEAVLFGKIDDFISSQTIQKPKLTICAT